MKRIVIFTVLLFISDILFSQSIMNSDSKKFYNILSGVWTFPRSVNNDFIRSFSWGNSLVSVASIVIDLGVNIPYISLPGQQLFIDDLKKIDNDNFQIKWHDMEYELQNYQSPIPQSDHMGKLIIHFNTANGIWFEWESGVREGVIFLGKRYEYSRTSGPE